MKTRYLVELCTLHGKTFQRRWSRVYFGQDKTDCQRWIEQAVADLPSGPGRHFGLTQERALQLYWGVGAATPVALRLTRFIDSTQSQKAKNP